MSLGATLKDGSSWIGHIDIRRVTNTGPSALAPDEVSDYLITYVGQDGTDDITESDQLLVQHRYGDGARSLMAMALVEVDTTLWERVNLNDE